MPRWIRRAWLYAASLICLIIGSSVEWEHMNKFTAIFFNTAAVVFASIARNMRQWAEPDNIAPVPEPDTWEQTHTDSGEGRYHDGFE